MERNNKIDEITGTITLKDGSTSNFRIGTDGVWMQGGNTSARLAETSEALDSMARVLMEDDMLVSDNDPEYDWEFRIEHPDGDVWTEDELTEDEAEQNVYEYLTTRIPDDAHNMTELSDLIDEIMAHKRGEEIEYHGFLITMNREGE